VTGDFELLAEGTSFDIVLDKGVHARPPIVSTQSVISLKFARMTCGRGIVISFHNFTLDRKVWGNVAFVMIKEGRFAIDVIDRPVRKIRFGC
jgi:hypothetical protein